MCGTFILNELFLSPLFSIILFFHNFKERLKDTSVEWCLDSARDETSYPSTNILSILNHISLWVPLYSKISVSFFSWLIPGKRI
jgi:hypothetical protein